MSTFKSTIAMMVAGGAIGAAGHASAATITYNYSDAGNPLGVAQNVNILGVDEYTYGPSGTIFKDFTPLATAALTGTYSQNPTPVSMDTYYNRAIKTNWVAGPTFSGDSYLNLSFNVDGAAYLGTAQFTTQTDPLSGSSDVILDSITYQPGGVPEPDSWALLIGGMGLAGAALRSKRGQAALAAAR